ncbi:MAG TPA: DUF222 domain-containing protein [Jiangellaceae bacterium]
MNQQVSAPVGGRVGGALDAATAAVAAAQDGPVYALADADLEGALEQCQGLAARVFDTTLALVREADERDLGRRQGGSSTAAWLAGRFRIRPGQARTLVRLANHTRPDDGPTDYSANVRTPDSGRELRQTGRALAAGAISPEHVVVVSKIMECIPEAISADEACTAEAELAGFCRQYDPGVVAKLGDYLLSLMAADTLDDAENERHRRRTLRLNEATGGISGQLTAEGMALLRTALDPLAAPNPGSDGERDPRTPGQRLVDALVELARRAVAADSFETNHGISHRVLVTIGLNTLTADHHAERPGNNTDTTGSGDTTGAGDDIGDNRNDNDTERVGLGGCGGPGRISASHTVGGDGAAMPSFCRERLVPPAQIQWGGLVSPAAAKRIACCASIQRVLLDPAGAVLDVGREYRTATPAQFAALIARDGGCAFPACTRPASWCVAHHIIHWADGGPTDMDNLVLLCTHHHTVVHHQGWTIHMRSDRQPEFIPPPWVDPDQQPRRNIRPRYGLDTITPHT